jgi:hypothetical protein
MIKNILYSTLIISVSASQLVAASPNNFFLSQPKHIFVNNRILAKVNGEPISVIDVMKKMDMVFYREFPQYANSEEARFQFYEISWKRVLQELIDKELIKADAAEVKLPITQGDIRQEIENMFGPNIIANLDKAGLSYEEASAMIKEDILIKRMMAGRVNSKVIRSVTPVMVRDFYKTWAKENEKPDQLVYQVISVRGKDKESCEAIANTVHLLLKDKAIPIAQLKGHLSDEESECCSISDEYTHTAKEISEAYFKILNDLKPGIYSAPIAQKSRAANSEIYRIFYLKEIKNEGVPSYQIVENRLKDHLIDKEILKEQTAYLERLHKHFNVHVDDILKGIPDDFQPFALK